MKILVFDPGDHTGWVCYDSSTGVLDGGTIVYNLPEIFTMIVEGRWDVVVYESFNLYPGAAKSLTWNEFYPCQVIGVIRLACELSCTRAVKQAPSVKRFSGGLDDRWSRFVSLKGKERTEHTKDAYLHLRYYERMKLKGEELA